MNLFCELRSGGFAKIIVFCLLVSGAMVEAGPKKRPERRSEASAPATTPSCTSRFLKAAIVLFAAGTVAYFPYSLGLFDKAPVKQLAEFIPENERPKSKFFYELLGQTHWRDEMNPDLRQGRESSASTEVIESQLEIARKVYEAKQAGPVAVFYEGLTYDLDPQLRSQLLQKVPVEKAWDKQYLVSMKAGGAALEPIFGARRYFNDQVDTPGPLKVETQKQRLALGMIGAPKLLWALGKLDHVYGAETAEASDAANRHVDKVFKGYPTTTRTYNQLVAIDREMIAIKKMIAKSSTLPSKTRFILIYGGNHDFKRYNSPWLEMQED